ncbi:MAG: hypothetical protein ACREKE_01170, partial [bacterium]
GLGLLGLFEGAPGWSAWSFPRALRLALLALAVLGYAWCDGGLWLRPSAAARTLKVYGLESFVAAPEAAQVLQRLCPPDKKLFIWGDDAELYFLARRRPASRFLFTYPFTGESPAWPGGSEELMAGLLDTDTGAAALSKGLNPDDPLQRRMLDALNSQYAGKLGPGGYILGARKQ